jgi:iron complex outermembrane receptor protein
MLVSVVLVLGGTWTALAQDAGSDEFMLEEITVTASKRSENQQKVAITMEVLSSEELKMSGKNDLDEILSNVSSVLVNKAADGLRISLRGISDDQSTFHNQSVSMPTVAVNMDGVYSNRKDTGSGLFDLERVEVLYGPQSTLYASNSPGGVVNVVTANPKLDKYEASGTIEYGNYELLHTEGSLNAPINNTMAFRAAYSTSIRDGYLSNGGDDEDSKSARLKFLFQPMESLSFTASGEISKSKTQGFGGVTVFIDQDDVDDPWYTDNVLGTPNENSNHKVYGRMNWDLAFGSLALVPSYATREGSGSQTRTMMGPEGETTTITESLQDAEEKSLELRISSSEDFLFKWIVGFNYYESMDAQSSFNYDESGNPSYGETPTGALIQEYRDVETNEEAKAIFANITYPVTNTLRAVAGYRQSWDDVILYNAETRGIMGGPDSGKTEEVFEEHVDEYDDPDYKIGFEYDLGDNTMLYADYSTSYRVQGMGGGAPGTGGTEKPPEKLKAYTVGAKNRFFDNKLQVNAAVYYYDYENYSAGNMVFGFYGDINDPSTYSNDYTQPDPNSSGWGDGRQMGIDVQATAIITPKDVLNVSVSYLNSEWTDLEFDYYYDYILVGVGPGQPWGPENLVVAETESYKGMPMTSSPEWTISVNYSHKFTLANGGTLEPKVDARYKSDYELSWKSSDRPYNYQEAAVLSNASLSYNNPDGNWSLSAYIRNITNYAEKRSYMGDPVNEMMVGNPRTYGAVLSAHF